MSYRDSGEDGPASAFTNVQMVRDEDESCTEWEAVCGYTDEEAMTDPLTDWIEATWARMEAENPTQTILGIPPATHTMDSGHENEQESLPF